MHEALCRSSGTTLDILHAERRAADHSANIGSKCRPVLLACLLHVLLLRHRRFLGAGLHLSQLSLFRGPAQMPICRTLVTAGDHIDWITTSPEAIRLTLSLNSFQKARNCPAFLASVITAMVLSISTVVMLPLSP